MTGAMMRAQWAAAAAAVLALAAQAQAATPASGADAGRWVTTATTGAPLAQSPNLSAFGDGSAFALADGVRVQPGDDGATGLGVVRSRDGGRTWDAPLTQPASAGVPSLAMADGRTGFFASGHLLSRTDDGAGTWKQLPVPAAVPGGAEYATALGAAAGGAAVLAKDGFEVRDGCPYMLRRTPLQFTANRGGRWALRPLPFTSYPINVELAAASRAVVTTFPYEYEEPVRSDDGCSVGGGLLTQVRHMVTDDAGRSWRTADDCHVPCVAGWADASTLVVVHRDGQVLSAGPGRGPLRPVGRLPGVSADAGQYVHAIDFLNRRVGYAAVYGAGTFRTDDGGKSWVLERREVEGAGVGSFGDVAAIDAVRAVAASTSGIHARIADPLPRPQTDADPRRGGSRAVGQRLRVDGTLVLPTHRAPLPR